MQILFDVSISGINVQSDWKQILEKYPLKFGFNDGKVLSVCPSAEDPVWAVNMKRAILSIFQTERDDTETDIIGECLTERKEEKAASGYSIITTKNIASCRRVGGISAFRAVPYIVRSAHCSEVYKVVSPFSSSDAITANVEQTLTFISEGSTVREPVFASRRSIVYDDSEDNDLRKSNPKDAVAHVDVLCKNFDRVSEEVSFFITSTSFTELVFILRTLSEVEIKSIADNKCKAFADALATCASADCMTYLTELVNSGSANSEIFQSFALLPNPDANMLKKIAKNIHKIPLAGYMSLSSMVHTYCLRNPECHKNEDVKAIVNALLSKLPKKLNSKANFEEVKNTIIILKSIGNIGYEMSSTAALNGFITDKSITIQIRLAAVDALRRKPCNDEREKVIVDRYFDYKENVEIRLAAFRQIMICANDEIVEKIITNLANEPYNQVGAYVTSYLNTKKRSKNPSSKNLQTMLKKRSVPERFNSLDSLRFSKYHEFAYFNAKASITKSNNYGGHVDSSVVFDPKGYIPREVNLNLTLHLFGKSYNVFEIGGRAEGLEQVHEETLGPDGAIFDTASHTFRPKNYKFKNQKANELSELLYQNIEEKKGTITASYYIRMFGDDVIYNGFQKLNIFDNIEEWTTVNYFLEKLNKEGRSKVSRNVLISATTQTLPTLSGLPIHFALNASVSSTCEHKARFNIDKLLARENQFAEISYETRPSLSGNVGASLAIKANKVLSGVRAVFTVFSSRSFGMKLESEKRRIIGFKIVVPDDDIVRAEINSRVEKIEHNRVTVIKSPKQNRKHQCTSMAFSKIFGLKGCVEFKSNYPEASAAIALYKVDPKLTAYEIKYESANSSDSYGFKFSMDTPGSKFNRKLEAYFELSTAQKKLDMGLKTPFKTLSLNGNLVEKVSNKLYDANMQLVNDAQRIDLKGKVTKTVAGTLVKYNVDGSTVENSKTKAGVKVDMEYDTERPFYNFNFNLDKYFKKPVIAKGMISSKGNLYEAKLFHSSEEFEANLESKLKVIDTFNYNGELKGYQQLKNSEKHYFKLDSELSSKVEPYKHSVLSSLTMETSSLPTTGYKFTSNRDHDVAEYVLEVTKGKDKATLVVLKATCTRGILDHKATVTIKNKLPQEFALKAIADTPKMKGLLLDIEYVTKINPLFNLKAKAEMKSPIRNIIITQNVEEAQVGKYTGVTHIDWGSKPTEKVDAKSEITIKRQQKDYGILATVDLHDGKQPLEFQKSLKEAGNSYEFVWKCSRGNTVLYDVTGALTEEANQACKFHLQTKYTLFTQNNAVQSFDLTANKKVQDKHFVVDGILKKAGQQIASANFVVPSKYDLLKKNVNAKVNWKQNNKMRNIAADVHLDKLSNGYSTSLQLASDDSNKFDGRFELTDKVSMKCFYEQNKLRMIEAELLSRTLKVNELDIDGSLIIRPKLGNEDRSKLKFLTKYNNLEANANALFEHNADRNVLDFSWHKTPKLNENEYLWNLKIDTPKGGVKGKQKLNINKVDVGCRSLAELDVSTSTGGKYALENDFSLHKRLIRSDTKVKMPSLDLKHFAQINVSNVNLNLVHNIDSNGKYCHANLNSELLSDKINFDFGLTSSAEKLKKFELAFGAEESSANFNTNLNDRHKGKLKMHITNNKVNGEYLMKVGHSVDNEAKFLLERTGRKQNLEILSRNFDKKFTTNLDVNGNTGIVVVTYDGKELLRKKLDVKVMNENEIHVVHNPESNEDAVDLHLRRNNNYVSLDLLVLNSASPFKMLLDFKKSKEVKMELTVDPQKSKKTYALENRYNTINGMFKNWNMVVKHPYRSLGIEVTKESERKYSLAVKQNMQGRKQPSVLEIASEKTNNGFILQLALMDDSLKHPLKCKFDYDVVMNSLQDYQILLRNEYDYCGDASKAAVSVFQMKRKPIAKDGVRFEVEATVSQSASKLKTRAWASIERKNITNYLIPVHVNTGVSHTDANTQPMEYSFTMNSDGSEFIEYLLVSPRSNVKTKIIKKTAQHYTIELYRNNKAPSIVGEFSIRKRGGMLELSDGRTKQVKLHVEGGMSDANHAGLEIWHINDRTKSVDFEMFASLSPKKTLKIKTYLPEAADRAAADSKLEVINPANLTNEISSVRKFVHAVMQSRRNIAEDIHAQTLDPFVMGWIRDEFKFAKLVDIHYRKSQKDIENIYWRFKSNVFKEHDLKVKALDEFLTSVPKSQIISELSSIKLPGKSCIYTALRPISDINQFLYEKAQKYQKHLASLIQYVENVLHIKDVEKALDEFKKKLAEADFIEVILREVRKKIKQYSLPDDVSNLLNDVEANKKKLKSKLVDFYQKVRDYIVNELSAATVAQVIKPAIDEIDEDIASADDIKKYWKTVVSYGRGATTSKHFAETLWKKYVPTIKNISSGRTEITVKVPDFVESLDDIFEILRFEHFIELFNRAKKLICSDDQKFLNTIYNFATLNKPFYGKRPPFKSVAYVIGMNGFISFDGRPLQLNTACNYILAGDFMHKTFLLTGKVTPNPYYPGLELTLEFRGQVIKLVANQQNPLGQLTVDGKVLHHLPYQNIDINDGIAVLTIIQTSNGFKLETYDGINLDCDTKKAFCQILLPGFMHGRNIGILGSNDNEPFNDHDRVDGTTNVNDNALAEYWSVERGCRAAQNNAEGKKNEKCSEMFNSRSSPFYNCFSKIGSAHFENLCSAKNDTAGLATAYRRVCTNSGIDVEMPDEYAGVCDYLSSKYLKVNDEKEVCEDNKPNNPHFILVVEEKECLEFYRPKIAKFASKITERFRDARFTMIGYGGEGPLNSPYVHSVSGSIVYPIKQLETLLRKPFENPSGLLSPYYSSAQAVIFAAKFISSKPLPNQHIVLIPCMNCTDDVSKSELLSALKNLNVKLSVFTTSGLKAVNLPKKVLGVDKSNAYAEGGVLLPAESVLKSDNVCNAAALESGGGIFTIAQKDLGHIAAARRIRIETDSKRCMKCKCSLKEDIPELICTSSN
uniref:Vitellogenin domain-containing protein n=1 Tax=Syphacia muris TaxID=451379 RepID=A0A158R520_9BILA